MEEEAWGILESLDFPASASARTSITTGKIPGEYGVFYFYIREGNSYEFRPVTSRETKSERVWDIIGRYEEKLL